MKLTLDDTMEDMLVKISDNHANAITVLLEAIKKGKSIDPYCDPFMAIFFMDTLELYGNRIWNLYKNCNWDITKFLAAMRGCQLGFVSRENLDNFIDNNEGLNIDEVFARIKERLPNFAINYEAERFQLPHENVEGCNVEINNGKAFITSSCLTGEQIAKRYFFLAYEASNIGGLGIIRGRSDINEDDIWNNVLQSGDYPKGSHNNNINEPYGDYVFGRMMKVGCKILENGIEVRDGLGRLDFQSWASKYPTFKDLAVAAVSSLMSNIPLISVE